MYSKSDSAQQGARPSSEDSTAAHDHDASSSTCTAQDRRAPAVGPSAPRRHPTLVIKMWFSCHPSATTPVKCRGRGGGVMSIAAARDLAVVHTILAMSNN